MQTYPDNSPEAAARVLAMAMLADGQYSMTEIRALDRQQVPARLGLTPEAFKTVVDGFCQDLLLAGAGHWTGTVDAATREQLMGEITERDLQDMILQQCEALMLADDEAKKGKTKR